MKSKRIAKILGVGLSVGLVFALIGAVFAAPAMAGEMKWTTVNTPDWGDNVITPGTDILDYDIGGDGDIVFAILEVGCVASGGLRDKTYDDACGGTVDGGSSPIQRFTVCTSPESTSVLPCGVP